MGSPLPGCSKYSKIEICSKLQKISLLSLYNSTALAFALKSVSNLPERTPYNSSPAPVYRRSLPWLSIFMINELAELSSKEPVSKSFLVATIPVRCHYSVTFLKLLSLPPFRSYRSFYLPHKLYQSFRTCGPTKRKVSKQAILFCG